MQFDPLFDSLFLRAEDALHVRREIVNDRRDMLAAAKLFNAMHLRGRHALRDGEGSGDAGAGNPAPAA